MDTVRKFYTFEDSETGIVLLYIERFKKDTTLVEYQRVYPCSVFFSRMSRSPAELPTIGMTPLENSWSNVNTFRVVDEQKRIYTYNEAVDYPLNAYAMDDVAASAAAIIGSFSQHTELAAVHFAEELKFKARRCHEEFLEAQARPIFVEWLPSTIP